MSCVCHAFASVHCCLVVTCGKGLTSWLLFVMSDYDFVNFPYGIPGQVWHSIVLIPFLLQTLGQARLLMILTFSAFGKFCFYIVFSIKMCLTYKVFC